MELNDHENHPYKEFESTRLWSILDSVIDDLVENDDLRELTLRRYIVGYFCKKLYEERLIVDLDRADVDQTEF
jgi:hypothetical protein